MIYLQVYKNEAGTEPRLGREEQHIYHHALMCDLPIKRFQYSQLAALPLSRNDLVVGSVQSVSKALELLGVTPPSSMYYPTCLSPWLHREVKSMTLIDAVNVMSDGHPRFIKPVELKLFDGQCVTLPLPNNIAALPVETPVWLSSLIKFEQEWRVYVSDDEIRGMGRYDPFHTEDAITESMVQPLVDALAASNAPRGYTLDVGLTELGVTVVECNDGWSLGRYSGIDNASYYAVLNSRWKELMLTVECDEQGDL
ncbi:ATP-grasp domain-containing protein [Vibrio splendidus]